MPLKHLQVFRRNSIALNTRKEERFLTNDLNFHLKKPEKGEQIKHKVNRREEWKTMQ